MNGTNGMVLNPLQRDGTSQAQRGLEFLDPARVPIDQRDPAALLAFAHKYAGLLRYYDSDNSPSGDWRVFLEHDISTLVALIRTEDVTRWRRKLESLQQGIEAGNVDSLKEGFIALVDLVCELASVFDRWYRDSIEGLALHTALKRLVDSILADALLEVSGCVLRAREVEFLEVLEINLEGYWSAWELGNPAAEPALFPRGSIDDPDDLSAAVEWVEKIYKKFFDSLVFLTDQAPGFFQETMEDYPQHQPHMALFLAFLNLYQHARDHLNTITAKHLDFYFKDVLQLQNRAAVPGQVHLIAELAKHTDSSTLAEGVLFAAGKDGTGKNLFYEADGELTANKAGIDPDHGLKTVFLDQDPTTGHILNIHAAPDADSADGQGSEIENEEGKWETYGGTMMPMAEIGFAVASPLFLLAGGERTITLKFFLDEGPEQGAMAAFESRLENSLSVFASGEKEWLPVTIDGAIVDSDSVQLTLVIDASLAAVVPYDSKALGEGFITIHPILKFLLDPDPTADDPSMAKTYLYSYLQQVGATSLAIKVQVEKFKNLILENDVGYLDPAKPFLPFGPIPRVGSAFLVGGPEVFLKSLTSLTLNITWADLPTTSFRLHYTGYSGFTNSYDSNSGNNHFRARVEILNNGDWELITGTNLVDLFQDSGSKEDFNAGLGRSKNIGALSDDGRRGSSKKELNDIRENTRGDNISAGGARETTGDFKDLPPAPSSTQTLTMGSEESTTPFIESDPAHHTFEHYSNSLRQGFLRLVLQQNFMHNQYPGLLAQSAISKSPVVAAPYTPLMAEISMKYSAFETMDFADLAKNSEADEVEQVFQIGPFGVRSLFPAGDESDGDDVPGPWKLVPEFLHAVPNSDGTTSTVPAHGTLFIGINGLQPAQNLSLLCQIAEGSEDPKGSVQDVAWSYLVRDKWMGFQPSDILSDGTQGLLASGVVQFAMPKEMTKDSTWLPDGIHWIKASVRRQADMTPRLIAIHAQALTARFQDSNNDPAHLQSPLAAGTISKLKTRQAAIKKITQPYASFGGRTEEASEDFYVRVSERLRHKERAIGIFDYERLVLEHFPDVHKVKCINHTCLECEHAPGQIRLVVLPDLRNRNAVDPLAPRLSQNRLEEIRKHLEGLASDFITLHVTNPQYEQICVSFELRLHAGRDWGHYTGLLQEEIVHYLSPWIWDEAAELALGGKVHRSAILNFIEKREYVDFVTDFRMFQIREDGSQYEVKTAEAGSSSVAIVSAPAEKHIIGDQISSCEDEAAPVVAISPAVPEKKTWAGNYLGNTSTRELHDVRRITPLCNIQKIPVDRRYFFQRRAEAMSMGYDYCAHCFGRNLSKR